jgi:hypothetical protein
VRADTTETELAAHLMENLNMTGTGYLTVRWKNGKTGSYAVRGDVTSGCLLERAGTRRAISQLAFFARMGHSLSGNATSSQKMEIKAWTPSYCHASSQAGSSQRSPKIRSRAGSFCPVGGAGLTDTCVTSSHPSHTCGRNLFLRAGFSHWRIQRSSIAQRDRDTRHLGLGVHHPGTRPTGRCPVQPRPRWGQTK